MGVCQKAKVLGVKWYAEKDTRFTIKLVEKPSRRHVLILMLISAYNSLFVTRKIHHSVVPREVENGMNKLMKGEHMSGFSGKNNLLMTLENVTVTVCYKPKDFGKTLCIFCIIFLGHFFGLIDQLSFGLQKKHLCDRQLFKPVNDDDPEFKNKLQLNSKS